MMEEAEKNYSIGSRDESQIGCIKIEFRKNNKKKIRLRPSAF